MKETATNYKEYALNDSTHWEWHTTFVGMHMQHNYRVYHILDEVFKANPQIARIVEIGTGDGALTTYLALWAINLGISIATVDNTVSKNLRLLQKLFVRTIIGDESSDDTASQLLAFISNAPIFLLCDGGCKQREFDYWAPRLPKDSIISVHDLGTEFDPNLASSEAQSSTAPILKHRWMEMNSQLAIYQVK